MSRLASDARIGLDLAGRSAGLIARQARASVSGRARRRGAGWPHGAQPTVYDPLDPRVVADPYPAYRELLAGGPLHYCRRHDIWVVSRYDDVRAAARAHDSLSSAESVVRLRHRLPMMLTQDRPAHARLRRVLAKDFTGQAMRRRQATVERLTADALDAMLAAGETDAVARLTSPLPVAVIADLLGVPAEDLPDFRRWSDRVVEGFALEAGAGAVGRSGRVLGATMRLHRYLGEQLDLRRREPRDDLLSRLLASADDGELTQDEVFWFALMLLVAGNETTTNLLGSMIVAFAQQPEQFERVRHDPALAAAAVEETLRHVSPIQGFYRTALEDHQVGEATIPAGARVLLLFGAANRDPRRYDDPDSFLVERAPADHLAFGSGIHFCLGAHLARLEGEVVARALAGRVAAIELRGTPAWGENPNLRGPSALPVRLRAQ